MNELANRLLGQPEDPHGLYAEAAHGIAALLRELAAAKRTLSAVHASLCNIHDRCIDNVDVDEESGTGDRTPNLEGHIVMECDEAIAAIERVIGKRA